MVHFWFIYNHHNCVVSPKKRTIGSLVFLGGLIEDPFVILAPWGPSEAEQGPETWGLGVKLPWLSVNIKMLVVGG